MVKCPGKVLIIKFSLVIKLKWLKEFNGYITLFKKLKWNISYDKTKASFNNKIAIYSNFLPFREKISFHTSQELLFNW